MKAINLDDFIEVYQIIIDTDFETIENLMNVAKINNVVNINLNDLINYNNKILFN